MTKIVFMCTKRDGQLVLDHSKIYRSYVEWLKDGHYVMSIRKPTRPKTLPQLAYYYGVILPAINAGMREQGNSDITINTLGVVVQLPLTDQNIDTYILKPRFARQEDGKHIDKADMTIEQASEFIDACVCWAAQYLGCVIPASEDNQEKG